MAGQSPGLVYIVGYGTFLRDVLISLAKGDTPVTWGEPVNVLGPVRVPGYQRIWPGNPPFPIIRRELDSSFVGILFRVPLGRLSRFDRIEGVPDLYHRTEVEISWRGEILKAFVYVPGEELLQHFISQYRVHGKEPGIDDWLVYLDDVLTPDEKAVFPEIFDDIHKGQTEDEDLF
jgi:gamma-glutamylcyclotransferase (GGCT)/AIG2-like uncharacterized protein YtfP